MINCNLTSLLFFPCVLWGTSCSPSKQVEVINVTWRLWTLSSDHTRNWPLPAPDVWKTNSARLKLAWRHFDRAVEALVVVDSLHSKSVPAYLQMPVAVVQVPGHVDDEMEIKLWLLSNIKHNGGLSLYAYHCCHVSAASDSKTYFLPGALSCFALNLG